MDRDGKKEGKKRGKEDENGRRAKMENIKFRQLPKRIPVASCAIFYFVL